MYQSMGLFVAKCGESDYRYTLSKSSSYVSSQPKQYFNDESKSFSSIEEAMSIGISAMSGMGLTYSVKQYLGDFTKFFTVDDDWDNHVGDVVDF